MSLHRTRHEGAAVDVLLTQMLRKEKEYSRGILDNHSNVIAMSEALAYGNELEGYLDMDQMKEHRNRLKTITSQNIAHVRQIEAYIEGLRTVQQEVQQENNRNQDSQGSHDNEDGNGARPEVDFSKKIKTAMASAHARIQENGVEEHQETMYLEVCEKLNEPKQQDPGDGNGNGADEDDDDIAVIPFASSNNANLKCPITGVFMENPVKNKLCGHVFEKHAILNHLKSDRRGRCPVAGCRNHGIKAQQLEEDRTMLQLIRRQKIREERKRELELHSQNAIEMDDEDETV